MKVSFSLKDISFSMQYNALPKWLQEYLEGSCMEIYELARFPPQFHGHSYDEVALFLYDCFRAVLVAVGNTGRPGDLHSLAPFGEVSTNLRPWR